MSQNAPTGKTAVTEAPIHPLIGERWSPRAFDATHELTDAQVTALLEAVRWAPSASNTQPWRLAVARRGSAAHKALFEALAPGNQLWAGAASALVVVATKTTDAEGNALPWAVYDAGQAGAYLSMQASHEGLHVHQMGGFDRAAVAALLDAPDDVVPQVVIAVGLRDAKLELPEPFAARESAPRERRTLDELTVGVTTA